MVPRELTPDDYPAVQALHRLAGWPVRSAAGWRWLYDNQVQGINRVQKGEWLELFRGAGFEIVAEDYHEVDISRLKIAPRFEKMDRRDLATTAIRLTMRKPVRS